MQHESRNGTVNTATHRYQDFSFTAHNLSKLGPQIYEKTRCGGVQIAGNGKTVRGAGPEKIAGNGKVVPGAGPGKIAGSGKVERGADPGKIAGSGK